MSHVDEATLHALLDGELAPAEVLDVQTHFATCPACSSRLDAARKLLAETERLVSALEPSSPPGQQTGPRLAGPAASGPASAPPPRRPPDPFMPGPGAPQVPNFDSLVLIPNNPTATDVRRSRLRVLGWAAGFLVIVSGGVLAIQARTGLFDQKPAGMLKIRPEEFSSPATVDGQATVASTKPAPAAAPTGAGAPPQAAAPAAGNSTAPRGASQPPGPVAAPAPRPSANVGPAAGALAARQPAAGPPADAAAGAPQPATTPGRTQGAAPPSPGPAAPPAAAAAKPTPVPPAAKPTQEPTPAPARNDVPAPADDRATLAARAAKATEDLDRERIRERAAAATAALDSARRAAAADSARRAAARQAAAAPAPAPVPTIDQRSRISSRIGLDEAARQLGGPLHAIDGMSRMLVGIVSPQLVPGADSTRGVVRAVYMDHNGHLVFLDQQRVRPGQTDLPYTPTSGRNGELRWMAGQVLLVLQSDTPGDSLRFLWRRIR